MAKRGEGTNKTQKAPPEMNEMIETLLSMASNAPSYTFEDEATEAKLYEIVVLAEVLEAYPGSVSTMSPGMAATFKLAGAPAKANKGKFTFFQLSRGSTPECEVWLSVEVSTLSCYRAGGADDALSSRHEIDVGVFVPLPTDSYPSFAQLIAGFSCKHMNASKAHIRELLGLRRETAVLAGPIPSRAPWLVAGRLPADPASPLFLISSDARVLEYACPIDELGAYVDYVCFN
ncbi:hypothetical protein [Burkholderia ubonensis]|uniref:hypothetical protein n=1 Tax=Burkholderia ubonensis TaxID=101571 RepID=UPI000A4A78E2|nr:hypothetical protein [Burkholderia ubonensis]